MTMQLRKVDEKTYVNVGDGNIATVTVDLFEPTATTVSFVSGYNRKVLAPLEDVVRTLRVPQSESPLR